MYHVRCYQMFDKHELVGSTIDALTWILTEY